MTVYIHPYNMRGKSALEFKTSGLPLIGGRGGRYQRWNRRNTDAQNLIVNWGCSSLPSHLTDVPKLNPPEAVALWSDKKAVAEYLMGNPTAQEAFVLHTTDINEARSWITDGRDVVARTLSRASNGRGITLIDAKDSEGNLKDPEQAVTESIDGARVQLWTRYQKKIKEYRIHVGWDHTEDRPTIITGQRKAKRRDAEYVDTRIRNAHDTGAGSWVFLQDDNPPEAVSQVVLDFWNNYCTLDFGGVDVIYNRHFDRAWIVEINTAPGVGPNDVQRYTEYFNSQLSLGG